jgi:predicted RNA-binding Zn ribbon-like protein
VDPPVPEGRTQRPTDLRRWISLAIAPVRGPIDDAALEATIALRESVFRAAMDTIDGRPPRRADRVRINDWAGRPGPYRILAAAGASVRALRPEAEVESALAAIATDAIDLLASQDGRLRRCEGPDCALLFHDASRPGRRRWCSTERCGNRVNTSAYRRRNAPIPTEE